jgi:hypothetical protein
MSGSEHVTVPEQLPLFPEMLPIKEMRTGRRRAGWRHPAPRYTPAEKHGNASAACTAVRNGCCQTEDVRADAKGHAVSGNGRVQVRPGMSQAGDGTWHDREGVTGQHADAVFADASVQRTYLESAMKALNLTSRHALARTLNVSKRCVDKWMSSPDSKDLRFMSRQAKQHLDVVWNIFDFARARNHFPEGQDFSLPVYELLPKLFRPR